MIVVFGSLNIDLILSVDEHPRTGETVLCNRSLIRPGGKGGNQAVAAARAGGAVAMHGCVGNDAFGAQLIEALRAEGVDSAGIKTVPALTGCAAVALDADGNNVIYVAAGANAATRAADVPDRSLSRQTVVVAQMEVPPRETWQLLRRARAAGARTILNLAPAHGVDDEAIAAISTSVDVLVLNRSEASQLGRRFGRAAQTGGDVPAIAALLSKALRTACVVTNGADGVCAADGEATCFAPALAVPVVDTTGAGDTFTGVLAVALDRGLALPEGLREASLAASLACRAVGAQDSMPTRAEIDAHLPPTDSAP